MMRYVAICAALFALSFASHQPFILQFQWNYINYTWPSNDAYLAAKSNESYIEKNNIINGIKIWKDRMYLSVPRYREGIPVTLAVTSDKVQNGQLAPLLEPYPNWDMQKIGDCSSLQNVYNMEIDLKDRMWVLDTGRVATMTLVQEIHCPPRLVIFDLNNNGTVLRSYVFPENVTNYKLSTLKNIVIDHEHGGMAYITDSDLFNPGIIVYSLANNTSWKVYHKSMDYVPDAVGFKIDGVWFYDKMNINGIALSPASTEGGNRTVFYSALSSFDVFCVKTQALIDSQHYNQGEVREKEIHKHIKNLGHKISQSDSMVMSNTGRLYYNMLQDDGISIWESKSNRSFKEGQQIVARDLHLMQWPTSLSFSDKHQLWLITNRFQLYTDGSMDITKSNFRVIMCRMDYDPWDDEVDDRMRSYQYREDNTAPEWPDIKIDVKSLS